MKLPKKIRISAFDVFIQPETDENYVGRYFPDGRIIRYRESYSGIDNADTLIHELLHAIVDIYKVPMPSEEHEEAVVSMMATGLVQVMRDNKQLMKFINDALKI